MTDTAVVKAAPFDGEEGEANFCFTCKTTKEKSQVNSLPLSCDSIKECCYVRIWENANRVQGNKRDTGKHNTKRRAFQPSWPTNADQIYTQTHLVPRERVAAPLPALGVWSFFFWLLESKPKLFDCRRGVHVVSDFDTLPQCMSAPSRESSAADSCWLFSSESQFPCFSRNLSAQLRLFWWCPLVPLDVHTTCTNWSRVTHILVQYAQRCR